MTDAFPPISLEPLPSSPLPWSSCCCLCSHGIRRTYSEQAYSEEQHSKQQACSEQFSSEQASSRPGQTILRSGGVVRGLANWGVFALPRPITRAQMKHKEGHYFVMRYDASARAHQTMRSTISLDPRVIRSAHVKVGDGKLGSMARFGAIKWDVRDE
ncbi:37S ribosomal protein Mrp17 [Verticillium dahliae VdLs.17]|uniref:37S ribosomal protein Mrp17 n=1 Tax=Verticillium dahliae (strain VdLs.17 / ATCC MYA-4575 / FGSC 10137) TaxID=498257 RepID=G2XHV3_VERDV|nr:37S ribosomal protein Mrp17 [Verticillium dahliae VdLs.17]EGY19401.1 37S ribosomal protein Mrp17 [Verticillium dahliae VdLs.17]